MCDGVDPARVILPPSVTHAQHGGTLGRASGLGEAVNTLRICGNNLSYSLVGLFESSCHPVDPIRRIKHFDAKRPEAFGGTGCAAMPLGPVPLTLVFIRPRRLLLPIRTRGLLSGCFRGTVRSLPAQHFTISQ